MASKTSENAAASPVAAAAAVTATATTTNEPSMVEDVEKKLTFKDTKDMSDEEFYKAYKEGKVARRADAWTEENWEEEFDKVPIFMQRQPTLEEIHTNPQLQAMTQIFHDDYTPLERAETHKEQGNQAFKNAIKATAKKARTNFLHQAVECWSEGLKEACGDNKMDSVLMVNRAAANLLLGNCGKVKSDCAHAITLDPNNIKAYYRHACASNKLEKWDDAIEWCDKGLRIESTNASLTAERQRAVKARATEQKKARKAAAAERKRAKQEAQLKLALEGRGIVVKSKSPEAAAAAAENSQGGERGGGGGGGGGGGRAEASLGSGPKLDEQGFLHWPVLLAYPEAAQTDFIEDCLETTCFADHLAIMFPHDSVGPVVPWDVDNKYKSDRLAIYFETDQDKSTPSEKRLVRVPVGAMIGAVIGHKEYVVYDGTVVFILLAEGSEYQRQFEKQYRAVIKAKFASVP
eukprot:UC1_evm3s938